MSSNSYDIIRQICDEAAKIGFDACGVTPAIPVADETRHHFTSWLDKHFESGMTYMNNYLDKRLDPSLLVEGAKSIICVALNYYPSLHQPHSHPQFAYYAYGKDYHDIMREMMRRLLESINRITPVNGRVFCDTAPILERYWAVQAGIGFIGRNTQLIIPGKGSYFFLGEIICDLELPASATVRDNRCGSCNRCIQSCPTKALCQPFTLDSQLCISYQTIENRGEIPANIANKLQNQVYGCDICQKICPWNRFASPNKTPQFSPSSDFLSLDKEKLQTLTPEFFSRIFKNSAVKRAKFSGLARNVKAIK